MSDQRTIRLIRILSSLAVAPFLGACSEDEPGAAPTGTTSSGTLDPTNSGPSTASETVADDTTTDAATTNPTTTGDGSSDSSESSSEGDSSSSGSEAESTTGVGPQSPLVESCLAAYTTYFECFGRTYSDEEIVALCTQYEGFFEDYTEACLTSQTDYFACISELSCKEFDSLGPDAPGCNEEYTAGHAACPELFNSAPRAVPAGAPTTVASRRPSASTATPMPSIATPPLAPAASMESPA